MQPKEPAEVSILYWQKDDFGINTPGWMGLFSTREYAYLTHLLCNLLALSNLGRVCVQCGERGSERALHIYEPFIAWDQVGHVLPAVISIVFDQGGKVSFWLGWDKGIGIFSDELTRSAPSLFSVDGTTETDFLSFLDAIGEAMENCPDDALAEGLLSNAAPSEQPPDDGVAF